MLRRVGYRQAAVAVVFTSLWFVLGFLLLRSPVPGALHIQSKLLVAWLLLFFAMLAIDGIILMLASINGAFPPASTRPARPAGRHAGAPPQTGHPPTAAQAQHATGRPAGRANAQRGR